MVWTCMRALRPLSPVTAALIFVAGCTSGTSVTSATVTTQAAALTDRPVVVTLVCYAPRLQEVVSATRRYRLRFTIRVTSSGRPDFAQAWAAGPTGCGEVRRDGGPFTDVEQAAYDMSGYRDHDITPLYRACTEVDPDSSYVSDGFRADAAEARQIRAALLLCPDHPFAEAWQKAMM